MSQWKQDVGTWGNVQKKWNWAFDKAGNRINEQIASINGNSEVVRRQAYGINDKDQATDITSGGPVHVSGFLDRPGVVEAAGSLDDIITGDQNSYAGWIDASSLTAASITAHDYSSNTVQEPVTIPAVDAPEYALEYDANGNVTVKEVIISGQVDPWQTQFYEWDANDRLTAVETIDWRSKFSYDGMGRLSRIQETNLHYYMTYEEIEFAWDGLRIQKTLNSPGMFGPPDERVYHNDGFIVVNDIEALPYYYEKDHLGSITR